MAHLQGHVLTHMDMHTRYLPQGHVLTHMDMHTRYLPQHVAH